MGGVESLAQSCGQPQKLSSKLTAKLLNCTKNRTSGYMLSNIGACLGVAVQYMLLFLVLAVNSDQFQILQSYTLLLKPPVLMIMLLAYAKERHTWMVGISHMKVP